MVYMARKIRYNVYLHPEQKQRLDKLAAKSGAVIAELIRRAIDDYLNRQEKKR